MKTYMLIIHALINKFHKDTSDIENIGHLFVLVSYSTIMNMFNSGSFIIGGGAFVTLSRIVSWYKGANC